MSASIGSMIGLACIVSTAAGCARTSPASATVPAVFAVLQDSIRKGGEATRVISAPERDYQRPAPPVATHELGTTLGLSISPRGPTHPSCRWSPADSTSIGMDISVTEFEVIGDSAKVSVLRECEERQRGRVMTFQFEPTWLLKRRNGRWFVVETLMRVTDRGAPTAGLWADRPV